MSEAGLPDDPKMWPRDPYTLLGVGPKDDLVNIRRAYTQLIRRYKPEHFPEQFILLRTAYEQITSHRDSFRNGNEFDRNVPMHSTELTHEWSDRYASQSTTDTKSFNKLDEVWNLASRGLLDEALAELAKQSWQKSDLIPVTLAKYWITKLQHPSPEEPQAIKILLVHLHLFRHLPNIVEIVEEELQFHASFVNLIDLGLCLEGLIDMDEMLDLVQLRWTAALRTSQFELIAEDWKLLDRLYRYDKCTYAELALALLDFMAWSDNTEHHDLVHTLCDYLKSDLSLEHHITARFDRIDILRSVSAELAIFRTQCSQWKEISQWVPLMWNDVTTGFAAKLSSWLIGAIHSPCEVLRFFDDLQPYPNLCQFCLPRLRMLVEEANEFAEPDSDRKPAAHLHAWRMRKPTSIDSELIEEFLSNYNDEPYSQFRIELARFSLQKNVMPPKILAYIEERNSVVASYFFIRFLEKIKSDAGLAALTQVLCNCLF